MVTICLVCCALAHAQPPDKSEWQLAPQLLPGMELVYAGTYIEEALMPGVKYQRRYRLDTVLFVLEAEARRWDVAFMTTLSLRDQVRDAKAPAQEQPASVRLELTNLDSQGQLKGTSPLVVPIGGPPTLECGMVVSAPITKVGPGQFWEVNEEGRPPRTWQVHVTEPCNGVTCVKLIGQQQSDDWDRPRADRTAWRRRDTVWIAPQLGVAQKVERVIERREPARRDPTHRATITYDLESRLKYPGRLLEDRRQEVLRIKKLQDDARPLLAQPNQHRLHIDALLRKIAYHLEHQPPTPYRKAAIALRERLELARRGEVPPDTAADDVFRRAAVGIGQRVPDFVVTDLTGKDSARMARMLGRPVLVFFYNPATDTGKEVLRFAFELHQKQGSQLGIMAMAVTSDADLARKQHAELKLPFAVLDGKGLHQTFGVDATPRLVVLDGEGIVRSATTGWGAQTAREITDELLRCLGK
jgi:peroxiredoxin